MAISGWYDLPARVKLVAAKKKSMSHILNLIEKQIAMSDVRNRLTETHSRMEQYMTEKGAVFGPCLLISRECGSGGSLVAQRAGELLGWNVFDAKIVDEIAQSAHVHQRLVQSVDEHIHSGWEQGLRDLLLDDLSDKRYLRKLHEVIMALGHHGNVVIVGRGAQYFLPSQCAVRVRLVAPLETRAKRVAERRNLSLEEARLKVQEIDKERAAFVRKIFKKDVSSPLNQDITINTGQINIETAVKIALAVLQEKLGVSAQKQPDFCKEMPEPSAAQN
jgi:cytidylate kinase